MSVSAGFVAIAAGSCREEFVSYPQLFFEAHSDKMIRKLTERRKASLSPNFRTFLSICSNLKAAVLGLLRSLLTQRVALCYCIVVVFRQEFGEYLYVSIDAQPIYK